MRYEPKIDVEKCIGDGACKKVCPARPSVFELFRDPRSGLVKAYVVNPSACNGCYACVNACPRQAIVIVLKR